MKKKYYFIAIMVIAISIPLNNEKLFELFSPASKDANTTLLINHDAGTTNSETEKNQALMPKEQQSSTKTQQPKLEDTSHPQTLSRKSSSATIKINSQANNTSSKIDSNNQRDNLWDKYSNKMPKLRGKQSGKQSCKHIDYKTMQINTVKTEAESGNLCAMNLYGGYMYTMLGFNSINHNYRTVHAGKTLEELKTLANTYIDYIAMSINEARYSYAAYDLACIYSLPPWEDQTEALAWTFIYAAFQQNYNTTSICTDFPLPQEEYAYIKALERAMFYIDYYQYR